MKMRLLAAAGVLVSAAVHLYLWFDVFRHTDVVGPAFMLNAVGGTVLAVLLVTWRHWIPLVLAVGFGASTLGAFFIAASVGLYGVHEHWTGWEVWTAAASEVVAILAAGTLLLRENPLRSGNGRDQPLPGLIHRSHGRNHAAGAGGQQGSDALRSDPARP